MNKAPSLEHVIMRCVRENDFASTNEVARYVGRAGYTTNRNTVRNTLRVLEDRGVLRNIGDDRDVWRLP